MEPITIHPQILMDYFIVPLWSMCCAMAFISGYSVGSRT